MSADSLDVRPDLVRSGIRSWDTAHRALQAARTAAHAGIVDADTAAVFGSDATGRAFLARYDEGGGPAQVLFGTGPTGGGAIVDALGTAGPAMAQALDSVLAQEAANRAAIAAAPDGGAGPSPAARA